MSKVVSFPKARDLNAEAKLADYIEVAKSRFSDIAYIFDAGWEESSWYYKSAKEDLTFKFYGNSLSEELENVAKIFVTKYLFDRRLKGELPSISQLRGVIKGAKRLSTVGIQQISEINQDAYNNAIRSLVIFTDRTKAVEINSLNNLIQWLDNEYLLSTKIDLTKAPKTSTLPALSEKMPDRELIRTIIKAKWNVEEADEGTPRWESDLLAVYTQAFQYGMGLRAGEVLRLPADPIRWFDGEMFFLVWTEKGQKPIARYVPEMWREVFEHSVKQIQTASQPYRDRAIELETRGRLKEVEERLSRYHEARINDVKRLSQDLEAMLERKAEETVKKWTLRGNVEPEIEYTLKDVQALMPEVITPTSPTNAMILKAFQNGI
ncbi:hypothetical protein [Neptuniibacter sp.]|uniref:hypothetical protein n=1 Tax=Neptuniibacter sp. TaxID=1962643 RepID=UPI003B5A1575